MACLVPTLTLAAVASGITRGRAPAGWIRRELALDLDLRFGGLQLRARHRCWSDFVVLSLVCAKLVLVTLDHSIGDKL